MFRCELQISLLGLLPLPSLQLCKVSLKTEKLLKCKHLIQTSGHFVGALGINAVHAAAGS